eukprot:361935-Chlamydomonas_euryale.AAC.18
MPVDNSTADPSRQYEAQRAVKALFCKPEPVAVVLSLVTRPLSKHPRMSQQDSAIVQLVLTFLRNLLAVPDIDASQCAHMSVLPQRLQAALLDTLFSEHAMELITMVGYPTEAYSWIDKVPLSGIPRTSYVCCAPGHSNPAQ